MSQELSYCYLRLQMSQPIKKGPSYQLTPLGWPGTTFLGWGYSRNIDFLGIFEAHSHICNIGKSFFQCFIRIALDFLFLQHTLKDALGKLVPNKIKFPGNSYFLKSKNVHFEECIEIVQEFFFFLSTFQFV